jgi:hypothetical protein
MAEEFAFIGHDFFGGDAVAKSNYRAVVKAAFDEVNRQHLLGQGRSLTPVYADTIHIECRGSSTPCSNRICSGRGRVTGLRFGAK